MRSYEFIRFSYRFFKIPNSFEFVQLHTPDPNSKTTSHCGLDKSYKIVSYRVRSYTFFLIGRKIVLGETCE